MATLDEIKKQIKNLGIGSKLLGIKEIKALPDILWEDEKLEKIVQGFYENGNGILIATNKRLVFVDKGMIYGIKVEDFPYDKISSIQYQTGILGGKITIFASGNKAEIKRVAKAQAKNFGDYVRARISKTQDHLSNTSQHAEDDMTIQLEKLALLKQKGILTEEEFNAKKKLILGL
ncbi:MAG TPA: hypothetical protein ENI63_00840 [Candidatus Kaiserbacteria bacterium]|nr:hypothetical protein [Candidatus Kaiserbacteria bacterium]